MGYKAAAKGVACGAALLLAACAGWGVASNETDLKHRNEELRRRLSDNEGEVRRLERFIEADQQEPVVSDAEEVSKVRFERLKPGKKEDPAGNEEGKWFDSSQAVVSSQHEAMTWYYQGLELMREKKYEEAARAFSIFVRNQPEHVYADRAQYWIMNCYQRNREFGLAVIAGGFLMSQYPYSVRIPEAMYSVAVSYLEMGQRTQAKALLRDLLMQYPAGLVFVPASRKLAEITQPNRG